MIAQNSIISIEAFFLTFLVYTFIIKTQNSRINWALCYSILWVAITLPTINYILVSLGFWNYTNTNGIKLPLNLFFVWLVFWAVVPVVLFKGRYLHIITFILFWLDIMYMPQLAQLNIITLHDNWIIGEIILLIVVWIPAYYWAHISITKKQLKIRAFFQTIVMGIFLFIIIPFATAYYFELDFKLHCNKYVFQFILIVALPALSAVQDLVQEGKGTPFPYDKTKLLVQNGVYAYCKNPIQWSFMLLFIPLSILYHMNVLLVGSVISILYAIGVANHQEYNAMESRFDEQWIAYKKNVPNWYFLWKPKHISQGTIYFKKNCNPCEDTKSWFSNRKTINLNIVYAETYRGKPLTQATYVSANNTTYSSVAAIARALEHINLAWASLAWFMRFPIINQLLQLIIDTIEIEQTNTCKTKK